MKGTRKRRSVVVLSLLLALCAAVDRAMSQEYVTDGLFAFWTFDEADIDQMRIRDVAGGHDARLIGTLNSVEGKIEEALEFTGDPGSYVEIPPLGDFTASTVECWAKTYRTGGAIQGIVSTVQWAAGKVHFKFENGEIQVHKQDGVKLRWGPYEVDTWYHIAYTLDLATSEFKLYVNGELVAESMNVGATPENMNERRVGWEHNGRPLEGVVDEVRIYERALTADEIMQNYEVETNEVNLACPRALRGEPDGANVKLTWTNGEVAPASVRVVRNGQELAAAAPVDPPEFIDAGPEPGLLTYELTFTVPDQECRTLRREYNACIHGLEAEVTEDGVQLTWENGVAYQGIRITRDDGTGAQELESSLSGTATSYIDDNAPQAAQVTYAVVPTNGQCDPATVTLNLACHLPAPVCGPGQQAELVAAFAFGSRLLECPTYNDTRFNYEIVWQGLPVDLEYNEDRGWGYEALYEPGLSPFGDRGGYEIFGPFDDTANNRTAFPTDACPEELYDSFIGAKNFTAECSEFTVGDPNEPCVEGGLTPEGIIFRVDVPNGTYRFVAAVGSADNLHAHRIVAEDGGEGPPDQIGPNYVVLVDNFQQAQFAVGEADPANPGEGVFARVGFDDKIPPPGDPDDEFPSPQFINMDENGFPTPDCASSPTLEVTQGYIRIHQLQANSNPGCGGERDPNGGDMVILELWRVEGGPTPGTKVYVGDANGDGGVNIADAITVLQYLFAGGAEPACMKAADTNDDDGLNIADAVTVLSYLFSSKPLKTPEGSEIPAGSHPGCVTYPTSEVEALGCATPCAK